MTIEDLYNVLLSDNPRGKLLSCEEQLFELIPELKVCKGFNQNSEWHIYDVYEHILHVVDLVPSNLVLRLAALFHDIGKPNCFTIDSEGVGHFYGHWNESLKIFNIFSNKYGIDFDISSLVSKLIFYHDINISKLDYEGEKMLFETFDCNGIKMLYQIKRADLLAQNEKYHYILDDYYEQEKKVLFNYRKSIILGTGSYDSVKSGNTVSVTGDGGNAWGYFGPAYKKMAPKLITYNRYAEKYDKLLKLKNDLLMVEEYFDYRRLIEDEYIESYYDIRLKDLDIDEFLCTLDKRFGKNIILLCHEPISEFCHRRLIADYIEIKTGIYIPEVSVDQSGDVKKLIPISYKDRLSKIMNRY